MAAGFPECEFLGIDIVPLQSTTVLPKNCSFELANVLEGIPKPDDYFDYVRQRFLVGAIPADKWKQHIRECVRICVPDGWVEIVETTGKIANGGPACQQFNIWLVDGVKTRGIDANMVQDLDELMREAGLINVTKQTFVGLFGPWGGKAGELFAEDYRLINSSYQPVVTSVFGVPKEEVERNTALIVEEFKSHQAYLNIHVYLGQKQ
jgi:ubiquinone/menaquinone biosynthesis C-methylase UbiE